MTRPFSLSKHERLKSKKDIDTLFLTGKAYFVFPFKVFYLLKPAVEGDFPVKFGISVPKKIFKRAVDRNSIKRKVREIYRLNKASLYHEVNQQKLSLSLMLVYTNKDQLTYHELEPLLLDAIEKTRKRCVV